MSLTIMMKSYCACSTVSAERLQGCSELGWPMLSPKISWDDGKPGGGEQEWEPYRLAGWR